VPQRQAGPRQPKRQWRTADGGGGQGEVRGGVQGRDRPRGTAKKGPGRPRYRNRLGTTGRDMMPLGVVKIIRVNTMPQ